MTVQAGNVGDELKGLIADGSFTLLALATITGIDRTRLETLLELPPGLSAAANDFSEDEIRRVSTLAGQLTVGAAIEDDQRLAAIAEALMTQFELSLENLARLTGSRPDDIEALVRDPAASSPEFKFHFAVRANYLLAAIVSTAS